MLAEHVGGYERSGRAEWRLAHVFDHGVLVELALQLCHGADNLLSLCINTETGPEALQEASWPHRRRRRSRPGPTFACFKQDKLQPLAPQRRSIPSPARTFL